MKTHQSMSAEPPSTSRAIDPDLHHLLDAIPSAAILHLLDGGILAANCAASELLGYSDEEWQRLGIPDIESPASSYAACPQDAALERFSRFAHRDGAVLAVEVRCQRITLSGEARAISILRDLSREQRAEQTLRRQREFRRRALDLSRGILESSDDLGAAVPEALRRISDVLDADIVSLTKISNDGTEVMPWHTWAHQAEVVELLHRVAPLGSAPNLARTLLEKGWFLAHNDTWPPGWTEQSVVREAGITSSLYVLLEKRSDCMVFFSADTIGRRSSWSTAAIDQVRLAGRLILDAIERREAHAALSKTLNGTILAFARTTEARDPFTAGHQERATRLALTIGCRLGMSETALDVLRVAAMLHDIGKLSIPAEFLARPGGLTHMERRLVEGHSQVGYEILSAAALPWGITDIVHQHHERLDGSGYPSGLRGEQILLEARILAVADVVEAMCSHRPYRPALGVDAALAEIRDGLGTRYDTSVAEACIASFEDGFRW